MLVAFWYGDLYALGDNVRNYCRRGYVSGKSALKGWQDLTRALTLLDMVCLLLEERWTE